ncbi:ATP synthase protein I [Desulfurobacterium thermolithotrophum DSM 11699]|uniref:ATP synthase protein I n=1 Tax=Desulfurobacterium thermolithotrophum (strain DSM 11699 / BSA) TaxID=868864 RepID=F0S1W1_DESTD|nr:AtpZ/AtpI family protein [Desulfurobacterium thermolithotrophum]ADY74042.1 ATP synthase protein I [Desulfurobacterium thermolithotrophum DSM 11699]
MGKLRDYIEKTSYMMVGVQFALSIIIGIVIGYYLDKWLDTFPWMTIFWFLIGFAAGLKNLYRELKKVSR